MRVLRRLLLGLAILVLLAIAAVIGITHTAGFNQLLLAKLNPYLGGAFAGRITIQSLTGSVLGKATLHDVRIEDQGQIIAQIPQATISASLLPLLWRTISLDIQIDNPAAALARDRAGNWNVLEALRSRHPAPSSGPSQWTVSIKQLAIDHGSFQITPQPDASSYRLAGFASKLNLQLGTELHLDLRSMTTRASAPGYPALQLNAAAAVTQHAQSSHVDMRRFEITTAQSSMTLSGSLTSGRPAQVALQLEIPKLAAADVNRIAPSARLKADLHGAITARGPLDAIALQASISAAGAALDAHGNFDLASSPSKYTLGVTLAHADIAKLIDSAGLSGVLGAKTNLRGDGFDLNHLTAALDARGCDLALNGASLGKLAMSAKLASANLLLKGSFIGPAGELTLDGSSKVSSVPDYQLKLTAHKLDLAKTPFTQMLPSNLNFDASAAGRGITLAALDTRLTAHFSGSKIAEAPVSQGNLELRVARQQLQLSRADFDVAGAHLRLYGTAGLAPQGPVNLKYRISSTSVARLLKIAGTSGDGALNLDGALTGTRDHLRTTGALNLRSFRSGDYRLQRASMNYALNMLGGGSVAGAINGQISEIRAGVELQELSFELKTAKAPPGPIALTLDAQDASGARNHLALAVSYAHQEARGHLEALTLALPDGSWKLQAPVQFAATPQRIELHDLDMRNGPRILAAHGVLATQGAQNFDLTLTAIDLASLGKIAPSLRSGTVNAHVTVNGTAAAPILHVDSRVDHLAMNNQRIGDAQAALAYASGAARLTAELRENRNNYVTANGSVPIIVSWAQGFKLRETGPLDLHVIAPRLDLARLALLAPREVRDVRGVLALDLQIGGSIAHPAPRGNLRIAGVRGEIVPLGVTITEAHGRVDLSPDQVRITNFSAQAGGGSLTINGSLALQDYAPGAVALAISFDRWPAIATQQYHATLGGNLALSGSLQQPNLSGQLDVLNGTLRPDLEFLTASSDLAPDETITVIRPGESPNPAAQAGAAGPTPPSSLFDRLAMAVTVRIHRDTWIRHEEAAVELEGHLQLSKKPAQPLRIVGQIHTVRGWIVYQGKRFALQSGTISFQGGSKIDPALDIDARYTLPDYLIDVLITGNASNPVLQLKSQPPVSQADILSLILFGKTTSSLGQGQQQTLQQRATQMAGGFAASQIGQAVSQSLGLEDLGFQFGGVGSSGSGVGFGRYVGKNTYVSASEDIGGTQGHKVSLQYYLLRWLSVITSSSSNAGSEIDLSLTKQY